MEILIGVVSTGIVEIIKLLSERFGQELSQKIVHGVVFGIVAVGAYMITENIISMDMVKHYIGVFTTAYTTYKLILNPGMKIAGIK